MPGLVSRMARAACEAVQARHADIQEREIYFSAGCRGHGLAPVGGLDQLYPPIRKSGQDMGERPPFQLFVVRHQDAEAHGCAFPSDSAGSPIRTRVPEPFSLWTVRRAAGP